MTAPDLTGKRVLVVGAETEVGRAVATAVAEAGGSVAAVVAASDAEAAFAVQRLARRLSSGGRKVIAQAIDAANEAAVRVMVRQVSKELGGLNAVVFCGDRGDDTFDAMRLTHRLGSREVEKSGGGRIILAPRGLSGGIYELLHVGAPPVTETLNVPTLGRTDDEVTVDIVRAIADEAESG